MAVMLMVRASDWPAGRLPSDQPSAPPSCEQPSEQPVTVRFAGTTARAGPLLATVSVHVPDAPTVRPAGHDSAAVTSALALTVTWNGPAVTLPASLDAVTE